MDTYSDSSIVSELELTAFAADEHKEDEAPWRTGGRSRPKQGKSISSKAFKASSEPAPRRRIRASQAGQGHPEGVIMQIA